MLNNVRVLVLVAGFALGSSGMIPAGSAQNYRQTDQQIFTLLDRVTQDARQFDRLVDAELGRGASWINTNPIENDIDQLVNELTETAQHLRQHVTRKQVVDYDVREVMIRGARIDDYMRKNRLSTRSETSWTNLRRELDELAGAFNLTWNWASPDMRLPQGPPYYSQLSGTYRLDPARSDDVQRIAMQATRSLPATDRDRVQENLAARLAPPTYISLDRKGQTVSIASEKAPMGTFTVDGIPRVETNDNGTRSTVRASLYGDQLAVTTTGNRGRDYTVTFEPLESGNGLEVTRSIEVAALTTPVLARGVYRRTADRPDWGVYRNEAPAPPVSRGYGVPVGTVLSGTLNTPLGTKTSREGDRFTMSIDGPANYRGATLEGVVTRVKPGAGRNELIFDFDRIRLRDGRTQEFEGRLSMVRTPNGKVIEIENEGSVNAGTSQSTQAVRTGAIGAAIGAIIGAVAGGGKGAAIGAAVGAGAGAGTVYVVGSSVELPRGTEIHVVSQPVDDGRLK